MKPIGLIVHLQVQRSSLKVGEKPRRRYDPAALLAVPALALDAAGVTGLLDDGERLIDVHHRNHPQSKNIDGVNGVSIGFTAHYALMRARFGMHLTDGIAGENIIVATDRAVTEDDVADGLAIETVDGSLVPLENVIVAEPCVEFSRYAALIPSDAPSDHNVTEALAFLRHGVRGYYATAIGEPKIVRVGDRLMRR